ncbi:MAG: hypothetical protein R2697_11790 [Ilumatobacteraceae bacterium]
MAGTYVPICTCSRPPAWGSRCCRWSVASPSSASSSSSWRSASSRGSAALYPIMGWCAVAAAPAIGTHLSPLQLTLVVAGGLAYTIGFPVLLLRRPDPWPSVFGYHESGTASAVLAALHFRAVTTLVAA